MSRSLSPNGASLLKSAMEALGDSRLERLPRAGVLEEMSGGALSEDAPGDAFRGDPALPDLLLTPVVGELLSRGQAKARMPLYVGARPARVLAACVETLLAHGDGGRSALVSSVGTGRIAYELACALGVHRVVANAPTEEFAAVAELGMALMATRESGRRKDEGEGAGESAREFGRSLPKVQTCEEPGMVAGGSIGIAARDSSLEQAGDAQPQSTPLSACVRPRTVNDAWALRMLRRDALESEACPLAAVIELPSMRIRNRRYPFGVSPTPLTIWITGHVFGIEPGTVRLVDMSSPTAAAPVGSRDSVAGGGERLAGTVREALSPVPRPSSAWGDIPVKRILQRRDLSLRLSSYEDVLSSAETLAQNARNWSSAPDPAEYARAIRDLEAAEQRYEQALARCRGLLDR